MKDLPVCKAPQGSIAPPQSDKVPVCRKCFGRIVVGVMIHPETRVTTKEYCVCQKKGKSDDHSNQNKNAQSGVAETKTTGGPAV